MTIARILREKGSRVISVLPEENVATIAGVLAVNRIGAVLVREPTGELRGIISERDIVRAIAHDGMKAMSNCAWAIMTRNLHTVRPGDSIQHALGLMTDRRIRHLPVIDAQGQLAGMISIGDLVKARIADAESEAETLREFVSTAG